MLLENESRDLVYLKKKPAKLYFMLVSTVIFKFLKLAVQYVNPAYFYNFI